MVEEETQHEIGKMSGMPMDKIGRPKEGTGDYTMEF